MREKRYKDEELIQSMASKLKNTNIYTLKVFNFAGTKFRECRIFSNWRVFNFANHGKIVISRVKNFAIKEKN